MALALTVCHCHGYHVCVYIRDYLGDLPLGEHSFKCQTDRPTQGGYAKVRVLIWKGGKYSKSRFGSCYGGLGCFKFSQTRYYFPLPLDR